MVRHAETASSEFWLADRRNADVNTMDIWDILNHLLRSYHQVLPFYSRMFLDAPLNEFFNLPCNLRSQSVGTTASNKTRVANG